MVEETTTSIVQVPSADIVIISLREQALGLLSYAEGRAIINSDDLKSATDDLSIISQSKKVLESKRKEYVTPLNNQVKLINDTFKLVSEPLDQADKITRNKMLEHRNEQERLRREQEEINRLRIEAAQKEMELNGELTQSVDLVEVIPEASKRTMTDMGSAGMRDNWKYEVVDFSLLPDDYKVPDTAMLNSIAKKHHDQKQVPGVKFYNEPIIAVSTR